MLDSDFAGSRGMIVLLEKQVHLQNDVGAIRVSMVLLGLCKRCAHSKLGLGKPARGV